MSWICTSSWG